MKQKWIAALLFATLNIVSAAYGEQQDEAKNAPDTFRISHFHHPEMDAFKALIKATYAQLGIKTTFSELPAKRGLNQINAGNYDADVVRLNTSITEYDNLLIVEPALVEAEILLLCLMNTPCDQSVLDNESILIASNLGNQKALDNLQIKAKVVLDETNTHSIDLLRLGRVDYVIYGSNARFRETLQQEFMVNVLQRETMYHVIHKRHQKLLPSIQSALSQQLILFDDSRR